MKFSNSPIHILRAVKYN